jgi:hypothetical protein
MAVRFFSALGSLSIILTFLIFIVSYAGFPDEVLVYVNSLGEPQNYLSKNTLFYALLGFLIVFNATFFGLKSILSKNDLQLEITESGVHISQIFFNLFFASSVYFINILNSRENFNYSNFGYMIYVSGLLLSIAIVFTLISRFALKK